MSRSLEAMFGVEFPLFAFSHCRDVVAAVSRAGGFGVLGGTRFTPETLEEELTWIDTHVDGKPYGIDIIFPEHQVVTEVETADEMMARIPEEHRTFVEKLMARHDVRHNVRDGLDSVLQVGAPEMSERLLDVAFRHPVRLVASALGLAPAMLIERAREHGVPVAALVGSAEHARRQVRAGVDMVIAQGTEAGAHCGDVSTLVLVPEVLRAVREEREVPVLAAGGIATGRQMAAMLALGAAGVWTGTIWLATPESEVSDTIRAKIVAASSRDTVRSRTRTGKPCRQLRSAWHDAWEAPGAPATLGMPVQGNLAIPALNHADRVAESGHSGARELASYYAGQAVGLIDDIRPAGAIVQSFKEEVADALDDMAAMFG